MPHWRILVVAVSVAACTPDYPMDREGTWSLPPVPANDSNLRAMVANPQDLIAGTGENTSRAVDAVRPVTLLNQGKRKKLPETNTATFNVIQPESDNGASVSTGP